MAPEYKTKDETTGASLVMKRLKTLYGLRHSRKNCRGIIHAFLAGIWLRKPTRASISST